MTAEKILLDVREMAPPEPYELATAALRELQPGQYLHMISARRPVLLYPWLEEMGFSENTRQRDEDVFDIYIWASSDPATAATLAGRKN